LFFISFETKGATKKDELESLRKLRESNAIERYEVDVPYSKTGLVLVMIKMFLANLNELSLERFHARQSLDRS